MMIYRIVSIGSCVFFFGFIAVWLYFNRGVFAGIAAAPAASALAFGSAFLYAAWAVWFWLRLEKGVRAVVGRMFGVTIQIERVPTTFRTTFQARTADGRPAGCVRNLTSGLVVLAIWLLALVVAPIVIMLALELRFFGHF